MIIRTGLGRLAVGAAAAASSLILASGTCAAAPAPAPAATTAEFVDSSSVPADQLATLGEPVPLARYSHGPEKPPADTARTAPSTTPEEDPGLEQECAKHPEADSPTGWIKNRFEMCVHRHQDLVLRNTAGDRVLGRLIFDAWLLGFAYDGQRRVDYVAEVKDVKLATNGSEDGKKWSIRQTFNRTLGSNSGPGGKVVDPAKQERDELLGEWDKSPSWTLTYTSPDGGPLYSQGNLQIVQANVMLGMGVKSPTAPTRPWQETDSGHSNVRFDYAGPVGGKYKGTVLVEARVELVMKLSDPLVAQSARHIKDAQSNPERTFPSFVGKTVPGEKQPLHRLIDRSKQDTNRTAAIKTCDDVWGNYAGSGLECDEYPFSSTYEGAAAGGDSPTRRYSSRLIDAADNKEGGTRILAVYTTNRILDGDPFYVTITP